MLLRNKIDSDNFDYGCDGMNLTVEISLLIYVRPRGQSSFIHHSSFVMVAFYPLREIARAARRSVSKHT
jgi:hypothetical protein